MKIQARPRSEHFYIQTQTPIWLSDRRWAALGGHFKKKALLYLLLAFSCRIIYFEISEKPFENVDLHQGQMLDRSYVITK